MCNHSRTYVITHTLSHESRTHTYASRHSLNRSRTHSLTHSRTHTYANCNMMDSRTRTYSLIHTRTHSLTRMSHSLIHSLTNSHMCQLQRDGLAHVPPHSFTHSLTNSHVSLTHSRLTHELTRMPTSPCARLAHMCLLTHSLTHSRTHMYVSLTHDLTHELTHMPTATCTRLAHMCLLTHSLTHSRTHSRTHTYANCNVHETCARVPSCIYVCICSCDLTHSCARHAPFMRVA